LKLEVKRREQMVSELVFPTIKQGSTSQEATKDH
jgi:hypothetical protein